MYHDGVSDHWPNGHPKDPTNYHKVVLDKFKFKKIHLCIAKLNNSVDKMIRVFLQIIANKSTVQLRQEMVLFIPVPSRKFLHKRNKEKLKEKIFQVLQVQKKCVLQFNKQ